MKALLPREKGWDEGAARKQRDPTLTHARTLRRNLTDAERTLWTVLRNRNLNNLKFKRQVPVGSFIADFMCVEAMLIVEVDGGQHADMAEQDARRTRFLVAQGFQVLRFWNNEVMANLEGVCAVIAGAAQERTRHPHPNPSPLGEGLNQRTQHAVF